MASYRSRLAPAANDIARRRLKQYHKYIFIEGATTYASNGPHRLQPASFDVSGHERRQIGDDWGNCRYLWYFEESSHESGVRARPAWNLGNGARAKRWVASGAVAGKDLPWRNCPADGRQFYDGGVLR